MPILGVLRTGVEPVLLRNDALVEIGAGGVGGMKDVSDFCVSLIWTSQSIS